MPAVVLWALMLHQTSGCTRGSWEIAISDPTGHNWICWYIYKGENGTSETIETSSEPRHITVQNQNVIFLGLLSEIDGIAIRDLLPYEVGDRPETWNSDKFVKEIWYRLYKAGDFSKDEYQDDLQKLTNSSQRWSSQSEPYWIAGLAVGWGCWLWKTQRVVGFVTSSTIWTFLRFIMQCQSN